MARIKQRELQRELQTSLSQKVGVMGGALRSCRPSDKHFSRRTLMFEPGLISQHLWTTSLMLLWPNGIKPLQPWVQKYCGTPSHKSKGCYRLMPMVLEGDVQQSQEYSCNVCVFLSVIVELRLPTVLYLLSSDLFTISQLSD